MKKRTKYELPNHLNDKILKGVSFINTDEPREIIKARLEFLEKEKNYTKKEISYILLNPLLQPSIHCSPFALSSSSCFFTFSQQDA